MGGGGRGGGGKAWTELIRLRVGKGGGHLPTLIARH